MRALVGVLLAMLASASTQAATTVRLQNNTLTGGKTLDVLVTKDVNPKVGTFFYALGTDGWSEAYAGATWSPRPYAQFALGGGVEDPKAGRVGGWLWLGKGQYSFIHCFEDGKSGPWHKTELDYQLTPRYSVGLVDKTSWGKGVVVGFATGRTTKVALYACEHTTTLALSVAFH